MCDVTFVDANVGWAVGGGGTIRRTANGGESWRLQPTPTTKGLNGVHFVDAANGWAVGEEGVILRTSTGGAVWTSQTSVVTGRLRGVFFIDDTHGWAVGEHGTVLRTTDGGATWTPYVTAGSDYLYDVTFVDRDNGWVVGGSFGGDWLIYRTTDGGVTWTEQVRGVASAFYYLRDITFLDESTGWAVGDGGTIVKTADGGQSWTAQTSGTSRSLTGVSFVDADNGWAVGAQGTLLKTANGGALWTAQTSGTAQDLQSVAFLDPNTGCMLGSHTIYRTTNGGSSWTGITGVKSALNGVSAVDDVQAWAVGDGGTIVHTTDGGENWRSEVSSTTVQLWAVSAVDANNCWAVGASGKILHTSDRGATWVAQSSGTTQALRGVSFSDVNNGYAVGGYIPYLGGVATILRTTDGGATWVPVYLNSGPFFEDVSAISGTSAFAVGQNGMIQSTTNGTTWWSESSGSTTDTVLGVCAVDPNNAWAVTYSGRVLHRGAASGYWSRQATLASGLSAVDFTDSQNGWAICSTAFIYQSTDAGATWTSRPGNEVFGGYTALNDVSFVDAENGWAVGGYQTSIPGIILRHGDTAAPFTQLITDPGSPDRMNGWFSTTPTITLTASEPGTTYYQWDSTSSQGWLPYIGPFTAPAGAHTLHYYSVDLNGNTEFANSRVIKVDGAAPSTVVRLNGSIRNEGWYVSDVRVSLAATDAADGSGVVLTEYSLDGTEWSPYASGIDVSAEGSTTVFYRSTDEAGNLEATRQVSFAIDKTTPVTSADVSGTAGLNGWYVSDVLLTLTASEDGSGLLRTEFSIGNHMYTSPVTISTEGTNVVGYRSQDRAGNLEARGSQTIKIDKTPPLTAIDLLGDVRADGTYASDVRVSLYAFDTLDGSGVERTEYSLDGVDWTTYASPVTIPATGETIIHYRSVDAAGNIENAGQRSFTIDTTSP